MSFLPDEREKVRSTPGNRHARPSLGEAGGGNDSGKRYFSGLSLIISKSTIAIEFS